MHQQSACEILRRPVIPLPAVDVDAAVSFLIRDEAFEKRCEVGVKLSGSRKHTGSVQCTLQQREPVFPVLTGPVSTVMLSTREERCFRRAASSLVLL